MVYIKKLKIKYLLKFYYLILWKDYFKKKYLKNYNNLVFLKIYYYLL